MFCLSLFVRLRMLARLKPEDEKVGALIKSNLEEEEAAKFKLSRASTKQRQQYQSRQWQVARITKVLATGGFGVRFAKTLAARNMANKDAVQGGFLTEDDIHFLPPALGTVLAGPEIASFESRSVAYWKNGAAAMEEIKTVMEESMDILDLKKKALTAALDANPNWAGSMGVIKSFDVSDSLAAFGDFELKKEAAGQSWMMCIVANKKRGGPAGYPMPGVASFFIFLDQPVQVNVTRIADVLSKAWREGGWY